MILEQFQLRKLCLNCFVFSILLCTLMSHVQPIFHLVVIVLKEAKNIIEWSSLLICLFIYVQSNEGNKFEYIDKSGT